ncbi:MAG: 16S rRNA (cytidine(1402)-2'-O)-methyltransferase [Elusimicrobia bacterium GWA2_69_24]|nr:MAG: 16S rRNA (cytidine(1402)-2'-O)-methyltransferase [Elusimicrobia bacterium GWA2_69_24]HBL16934.1 16S rRNA (cytidine(1402)-2'-O)-methyltransferase [Elusimicrobiota bacterium]
MLYVIATPIGNLEDVSARALRLLKEVRAVYCEDTRRTRILLSHFGISATLIRYQDRDERCVDGLLARLRAGEDVALASDSGTPVISDPGFRIVSRARAEGIPVCSVPGACAVAAAVAGSGFPGDSFVFLGFLPRTASKQKRALAAAAALDKTIVVYESPFRVLDLLENAAQTLGPETPAAVCRELTKLHEEWLTGTVRGLREKLAARPELLGEFVVLLRPAPAPAPAPEP